MAGGNRGWAPSSSDSKQDGQEDDIEPGEPVAQPGVRGRAWARLQIAEKEGVGA